MYIISNLSKHSDDLDDGGTALVDRGGHRVGVRIFFADSLPVILPTLHQRLGFGRHPVPASLS
jgi:hypothetical protein